MKLYVLYERKYKRQKDKYVHDEENINKHEAKYLAIEFINELLQDHEAIDLLQHKPAMKALLSRIDNINLESPEHTLLLAKICNYAAKIKNKYYKYKAPLVYLAYTNGAYGEWKVDEDYMPIFDLSYKGWRAGFHDPKSELREFIPFDNYYDVLRRMGYTGLFF